MSKYLFLSTHELRPVQFIPVDNFMDRVREDFPAADPPYSTHADAFDANMSSTEWRVSAGNNYSDLEE